MLFQIFKNEHGKWQGRLLEYSRPLLISSREYASRKTCVASFRRFKVKVKKAPFFELKWPVIVGKY